MDELETAAAEVARILARTGTQLVLAESCTAGLVAASLGRVPGVSQNFCGSAVTYQEATKKAWLDVPADCLESHGAVSAQTAAAMARGVLKTTPAATMAAAITGHLGPHAPSDLDGVIYIATRFRGMAPNVTCHHLPRRGDAPTMLTERVTRQRAAAVQVLLRVGDELASR